VGLWLVPAAGVAAALVTITLAAARTAAAATIAAGAVALFVLVNAKGDADPRAGLESGPTRAPLMVARRSLRDEIAAWLGRAAGRRS
jgi:hypothetical protein